MFEYSLKIIKLNELLQVCYYYFLFASANFVLLEFGFFAVQIVHCLVGSVVFQINHLRVPLKSDREHLSVMLIGVLYVPVMDALIVQRLVAVAHIEASDVYHENFYGDA